MSKMFTFALSMCVAVALISAPAMADTVVLFENDAAAVGDTSIAAASTATNVSSTAIANGPGGTLSTWEWPDAVAPVGYFGNVTLQDAIDGDEYATFTVTPDGGFSLNLDNFFIRIGVNVGLVVGDNDIDLLSSATGFTSSDSLATFQPITPTNGALTTSTFNVDLSSVAALQGVSGAVEFRLYYSDIGNRVGLGQPFATNGDDDIRIDGTVVPEPASLLLLGACALMGLVSRRRRK